MLSVLKYFWLEEYLKYYHYYVGKSIEIAEKCFLSVFSCCDCSAVGCFLGSSPVAVVCQLLCSVTVQVEATQTLVALCCITSFWVDRKFCRYLVFLRLHHPSQSWFGLAPYCHFSVCCYWWPLERAGAPVVCWRCDTDAASLLFDTFHSWKSWDVLSERLRKRHKNHLENTKKEPWWFFCLFLGTQETPLCHF